MQVAGKTILALDVGAARIGVAVADTIARLPRPLTTISNSAEVLATIKHLIEEQHADALVVGLPRGLEGQTTAQTRDTLSFITTLQEIGVPVYQQDEAVTSRQAEAELKQRGKPYVKGNVDALAATYILEDFLGEHRTI